MTPTRALLALQAATIFEISPQRRLMRSTDPDRSPAPRLHAAGGSDGWVGYVRQDVSVEAEKEIAALLAREPGVTEPGAVPRHAEEYRRILDGAAMTDHSFGPVHRLRPGTQWPGDLEIVKQHTPEGDALVARITRDGMPRGLFDAGFTDLSHFWEPWCVAMVGEEIASIAFCARGATLAREIGVYTLSNFRGRGLAAAVTAAWSTMHPRHPVLFYCTHRDNLSSQHVIARLNLPFLGIRMQIP